MVKKSDYLCEKYYLYSHQFVSIPMYIIQIFFGTSKFFANVRSPNNDMWILYDDLPYFFVQRLTQCILPCLDNIESLSGITHGF